MPRRFRTALTAGVVAAALVLMGAGFPAKGAPPEQWATDVCTAVTTWVNGTQTSATGLTAALSTSSPNLRDVRDLLVEYMGGTAQATTAAIDAMDDAGTPATPKGPKAAATLVASFKQIRKSLRKLQNQAEDISIKKQKKALKQIKALNVQVNEEFSSFQTALTKLRKLDPNHKLREAFQADAVCQAL